MRGNHTPLLHGRSAADYLDRGRAAPQQYLLGAVLHHFASMLPVAFNIGKQPRPTTTTAKG